MNNAMQMVNQIRNGNPEAMFKQMIQNNPQFKQFVEQNKGKTPDQIASENGLDLNMLKSLMK